MNSFSTAKLDEILRDRREKCEQERQKLLEKTQTWLGLFAAEYGIETAYIFGSVTRPYQFHQNSDVDLAVEEIDSLAHFPAISLLAAYLGREVDIIKLDSCHFADRIRSTGMLWKTTN
jgi:predicted nucleotidyltransferase